MYFCSKSKTAGSQPKRLLVKTAQQPLHFSKALVTSCPRGAGVRPGVPAGQSGRAAEGPWLLPALRRFGLALVQGCATAAGHRYPSTGTLVSCPAALPREGIDPHAAMGPGSVGARSCSQVGCLKPSGVTTCSYVNFTSVNHPVKLTFECFASAT